MKKVMKITKPVASGGRNEQGQVLLFAIVGITIALAVGTGIASQTISSVTRTSEADTASRALAAAEGGLEKFLTKPDDELEGKIISCATGDEDCQISYTGPNDPITVEANVRVEAWDINDPDSDPFPAARNQTLDIYLEGYDQGDGTDGITLCWSAVTLGGESELYYLLWGFNNDTDEYEFKRGGLAGSESEDSNFYLDTDVYINPLFPNPGHLQYCRDFDSYEFDPKSLRIVSYGDTSYVRVTRKSPLASSNILPSQGFKIISTGTLKEAADVKSVKTVTVHRSRSYLPHIFDHTIFTSAAGSME